MKLSPCTAKNFVIGSLELINAYWFYHELYLIERVLNSKKKCKRHRDDVWPTTERHHASFHFIKWGPFERSSPYKARMWAHMSSGNLLFIFLIFSLFFFPSLTLLTLVSLDQKKKIYIFLHLFDWKIKMKIDTFSTYLKS